MSKKDLKVAKVVLNIFTALSIHCRSFCQLSRKFPKCLETIGSTLNTRFLKGFVLENSGKSLVDMFISCSRLSVQLSYTLKRDMRYEGCAVLFLYNIVMVYGHD